MKINLVYATGAWLLLPLFATAQQVSQDAFHIPAPGNRSAAYVASTPEFSFYSDFWLNLHDYLYGIAGGGSDRRAGFEEEGTSCLDALRADQAEGWQRTRDFYVANMGERHHRRDDLMAAIRHLLTDLATEYDPDPTLARVLELLHGAAPAYRACLWEMHDARNRRRIGELVDLLVVYGPEARAELSRYYREPWPAAITLDVVSYSDFAGANTTSLAHTMMSSVVPNTSGFSGLELMLHEASHLMFGPLQGTIAQELMAASAAAGIETPGQLWHALSFYTSGEVVARIAKEAGAEYEPYARRQGLFDTAFRGYLPAIEKYWQPYLDSEVDLSAAMSGLIDAINAGDR